MSTNCSTSLKIAEHDLHHQRHGVHDAVMKTVINPNETAKSARAGSP
jgi:hypothetical protein